MVLPINSADETVVYAEVCIKTALFISVSIVCGCATWKAMWSTPPTYSQLNDRLCSSCREINNPQCRSAPTQAYMLLIPTHLSGCTKVWAHLTKVNQQCIKMDETTHCNFYFYKTWGWNRTNLFWIMFTRERVFSIWFPPPKKLTPLKWMHILVREIMGNVKLNVKQSERSFTTARSR